MPTARRAAASASSAPSAVAGPPQRVSARRRLGLNLRRRVADELGDASGSDDDRIDSRPLELVDLLAPGDRHVRDGELARGDVRKELQRAGERAVVVVLASGQEEDLGIEPLERELELFLVADLDDAVQPEAQRLLVEPLEPVVVLVQLLDDDEA